MQQHCRPQTKMETEISIGVIGCGYWGPNLVRNFRGLPNCKVKAISDLSGDRLRHLRNLYPEIEGYCDYRSLLGEDGPDAVAVAAPVRYHFEIAKECLRAGKHTLVE